MVLSKRGYQLAGDAIPDQIGIAIRDEVCDLEQAGIRMIQIDEAALKEKLPIRREEWYSE